MGADRDPRIERMRSFALGVMRGAAMLAGALLAAGLAVVLGVRIFGLPSPVESRLKDELGRHGLVLDYRKLRLNLLGEVVARDVSLRRATDPAGTGILLKRLEVGISWPSWFRREPLIRSIGLSKGEIEVPLDANEAVRIRGIGGRLLWDANEVEVEGMECRVAGVTVRIEGRVPSAERRTPGRPVFDGDLARFAPVWRSVRTALEDIQAREAPVVRVLLGGARGGEEGMRAEVTAEWKPFEWRGTAWSGLGLRLVAAPREMRLERLVLGSKAGGEIEVEARVDFVGRQGFGQVRISVPPRALAPAAKGPARRALDSLAFTAPPVMEAAVTADWSQGLAWKVTGDLDWREFRCGGETVDRLRVPFARDGTRTFIPEAVLEAGGERLTVELIEDRGARTVKARVAGSVNPKRLQAALPEGAQPFLNSCEFSEGVALEASMEGRSFRVGEWRVGSRASVRGAVYKGVKISRLETDVESDGKTLLFRDVVLEKPEGRGTAAEMELDLATRRMRVKEGRSQLHVQQTGHLFGGNFEEYCRPYVFRAPPRVDFAGMIDLGNGPGTDLAVKVNGGAMTYPFLGRILPPTAVEAEMQFRGARMSLRQLRARLYDGTLAGTAEFDFSRPEAVMDGKYEVASMDFAKFMAGLFDVGGVSGRISGTCAIRGQIGRMESLRGGGDVAVADGYLMSIPFLGGLSAVMNTIVPNLGYAKASDARGAYTLAEGFVRTQDLKISSALFSIICDGEYNFVRDQLGMDARVNVRGPAGLMLFPVSKLFEYRGTGPLKNPKWAPKLLGG